MPLEVNMHFVFTINMKSCLASSSLFVAPALRSLDEDKRFWRIDWFDSFTFLSSVSINLEWDVSTEYQMKRNREEWACAIDEILLTGQWLAFW